MEKDSDRYLYYKMETEDGGLTYIRLGLNPNGPRLEDANREALSRLGIDFLSRKLGEDATIIEPISKVEYDTNVPKDGPFIHLSKEGGAS